MLPLYHTVAAERLAVPAECIEAAHYLTFTSGSAAEELAALLAAEGCAPLPPPPAPPAAPPTPTRFSTTHELRTSVPKGSTPAPHPGASTPQHPTSPLAHRLAAVHICTIGPATSAAVRRLGLPVAVEAAEHTVQGLVAALVAHASRTPVCVARREPV